MRNCAEDFGEVPPRSVPATRERGLKARKTRAVRGSRLAGDFANVVGGLGSSACASPVRCVCPYIGVPADGLR